MATNTAYSRFTLIVIATAVAMCLSASVGASVVEASTYNVQTAVSGVATSTYGAYIAQTFRGVSGVPTRVIFSMKDSEIGGNNPSLYQITSIKQCDDVTLTTNCEEETYSNQITSEVDFTNQCQDVVFDIASSTITLEPQKYFRFVISRVGFTRLGLACGSYANPITYSQMEGGSNLDIRFSIYTDNSEDTAILNLSATTSYQTRITDASINQLNENYTSAYPATVTGNNPYILEFDIASTPAGTGGDSKIGIYSYDVDGSDSVFFDTCDGTIIEPTAGQDQYCYKTFTGAGTYTFEFTIKPDYIVRSLFYDVSNTNDGDDWYTDILLDSQEVFAENEVNLKPPQTGGFSITADYFINQSEIISTVSAKNPTTISFSVSKLPATTTETVGIAIDNTISTGTVEYNLGSLSDGSYEVLVKFSNGGCALGLSACPFPLSYKYVSFTITGGLITASTTETYNNLNPPPATLKYEDCGITNVSGCINNSFRFLFIPSDTSITALLELRNDLENHIPFSYALDIPNVVDELLNTEYAQDVTISVDILGGTLVIFDRQMISDFEYSSLIKTLIGYLLWIAFAMAMYRTSLNIFNPKTQ